MPKNKENLLVESGVLHVVKTLEESQGNPESEVWTSEVWRLDEVNLNGRVYTTALAERIVKENKKTMAYDGHDADWLAGHDYEPAVAYCDNPRIENNCLVVDIHFLESQRNSASVKNIRELFKAGIPIGVSSVGYGTIDENGIVQDDYELIRYLDFVSMPAGLVYAAPKKESETDPEPKPQPASGESVDKPSHPAVAEAAKARAKEAFSKYLKRR